MDERLFELSAQVEAYGIEMDRALAVLAEVENHFSVIDEREWLEYFAEHILLLIEVAYNLLKETREGIGSAADGMYKECRKMRKEISL